MANLVEYICWNEPLWTQDNPIFSAIAMALPEDCIGSWKKSHPQYPYTDEEALDDFMAVNWAWRVKLDADNLPWKPKDF